MTHPQTKETLIRLAWLTELRRQGERQCKFWREYEDGDGRACAIQLLWEVAARGRARHPARPLYRDIGKLAGLREGQTWIVINMNDKGSTFREIADVVEGWFK